MLSTPIVKLRYERLFVDKMNLRTHKLTPTCVCVDREDKFAFSGSKDGSIIKWCLKSKTIVDKIQGIGDKSLESNPRMKKGNHSKGVNCLAISPDNKYLATGGWDALIRIWNPESLELLYTFPGHKSEVTGLAFGDNSLQLFSASADKSLKLWSLEDKNNMGCVESFFGHEASVSSIDALRAERILSSGGRDQSLRIWKIVEQAQSIFMTQHDSVDIAKLIDDKSFVSGGEDGSIALWSILKRCPEFVIEKAHHSTNPQDKFTRYWITALATYVKPVVKDQLAKDPKRQKLDGEQQDLECDENVQSDDNEDVADIKGADEEDLDSDMQESEEYYQSVNGTKKRKFLDAKKSPGVFVASGSCNGMIKLWKVTITGSKYSMILFETIPCRGFVNDIQFTSNGKQLVAAVGQEHKSGRWWKINRVANSTVVFDINLS